METLILILIIAAISFFVIEYYVYTQFDQLVEIQHHRNIIMRERVKQEKEHLEFLKLQEIELKMQKTRPSLFDKAPPFQHGNAAPETNNGEQHVIYKNGVDLKAMEAKINMINNLL